MLTSWDGDDGVGDGTAEVRLSGLLHLAENHSGNFLRGLRMRRQRCSCRDEAGKLTNCRFSPLYWTSIAGLSFFLTMWNGQCFLSRSTSGSSTLRPMRRLASKTVFSGLEWKAFFAASPTLRIKFSLGSTRARNKNIVTYRRSSSEKETHEGVIR